MTDAPLQSAFSQVENVTQPTGSGRRVVERLTSDLNDVFRRLVTHHARHHGVDANDLYQEAMVRILKQRDVDPEHVALLGWVDRCTHYGALDLRRRASRDKAEPLAEVPEVVDRAATPEQSAVRADVRVRLVRLLNILTPRQREILLLRLVAGLSAEETADMLGLTASAVRLTQHRALTKLRNNLIVGEFL